MAYADANGRSASESAAATDPVQPQAMPAELSRDFAVFRRATRASESLEKYVGPNSDYVTKLGLNPSLARRITTTPGFPTKLWLAPTADGTCLMILPSDAIGPGGNCGPEMTDDPYLSADSSTNLDGSIDVIGMVHDGVDAVTLVFKDGDREEVPVADSVYAAHVTKTPRDVRIVDPKTGPATVKIAGY
jgi:hypothetical protein